MTTPKVAVVGLGKVGLPLAARYALAGILVTGCDVSLQRVEEINSGRNPIPGEEGLDQAILSCVADGRLVATTETSVAVKEADVVVVIVPLLALADGRVDFRFLDDATEAIAAGLHPGILVVYETTLPVGTTGRYADVLAEKSGLSLGKDLFVAFSPERVYSGRILRDLDSYPKVVGGVDPESGARAKAFYELVLPTAGVEVVESAEAAELVKLAETTYRDVNIAFANELARYADDVGVEVDEVIRLANTQPFSHIHSPGAGVGGHCIPHYPQFLLAGGANAPLVRLAREINDRQPSWLVERLAQLLAGLEGKRVLILGISYRENVKEATSSPGVDLIGLLAAGGAKVAAHDPYFEPDEIRAFGAEPSQLDDLGAFDAVVLQANHDSYASIDWKGLRKGQFVFDGRNALDPDRVVRAGATYIGVGRNLRRPS